MILVDTNVFLEILLGQEAATLCKTFLTKQADNIVVSNFSLHSVGVILFRKKRAELFQNFLVDVLPKVKVTGLASDAYGTVIEAHRNFSVDFDDAYQVAVAISQDLSIATLDRDFKRVTGLEVLFLNEV